MKLPNDNLKYPVKIIVGSSSGSGFVVRSGTKVYLVTAKHVVYQRNQQTGGYTSLFGDDLKVMCYTLTEEVTHIRPKIYSINLQQMIQSGDLQVHPLQDVIVIKLGERENEGVKMLPTISLIQESQGRLIHYPMSDSRKFNEVEVTNDIFVLGYPVSLGDPKNNQIDYDSPLVRKGIISGKHFKNKTLILDCPVYGGNSGGMVLEMNQVSVNQIQIHLIGIVVEFVPFIEQWSNNKFPGLVNTNLQNSGYSIVVPVDYICELINTIENR